MRMRFIGTKLNLVPDVGKDEKRKLIILQED
jgi:hypothetical protein